MIAVVSRISVVYSTGGAYPLTEHGNTDVNSNTVTGASRPANTPAAGYTINTTDFPKSACIHCHDEHSSYDNVTHTAIDFMLFDRGTGNKNDFCYTCHTAVIPTGGNYSANMRSWPGSAVYDTSGHGTSATMLWPGIVPPAKTGAGNAGKCVNCHDPHGTTFAVAATAAPPDSRVGQVTYQLTDAVLQMTTRVEENLCLNCHKAGGPAGADNIASLFALAANVSPAFYNHPINRFTAANDRTPSYHNILESENMYNAHVAGPPQQTGRHVECVDCHNPHYAGANGGAGSDSHTLGTNVASKAIYGTWGVRTAGDPTVAGNWPAAPGAGAGGALPAAPAFTLEYIEGVGTVSANDYEWELCIRCHSSYSQFPAFAAPNTLTDISTEINPNNLSHHAIVRPGKNQVTNATAQAKNEYQGNFNIATPLAATIYCSDCHTSAMNSADTAAVAITGPHGSANKFLVGSWCEKRGGNYGTSACATPQDQSVCFKCHKYNVYYLGNASNNVFASRWGHDNGNHMDVNTVWGAGLTCLACHGGGTPGGIHGSNEAKGPAAAAEPRGKHFMNGACLESFDYGIGGTNNFTCWTVAAANTYCLAASGCDGRHTGGGRTAGPRYDYCDPACPGS